MLYEHQASNMTDLVHGHSIVCYPHLSIDAPYPSSPQAVSNQQNAFLRPPITTTPEDWKSRNPR